jgi:hypothetical protein
MRLFAALALLALGAAHPTFEVRCVSSIVARRRGGPPCVHGALPPSSVSLYL